MQIPASRIDDLAKLDQRAAAFIRRGMNDGSGKAAIPLNDTVDETVRTWYAEDSSAPDAVVAPGLPDGRMLDALVRILPETTRILWMEHIPSRAADVFRSSHAEEHVRNGRLFIAFGEDESIADMQLMRMLDFPSCPTIRLFDSVMSPESSPFFSSVLQSLRDRARLKVFNLATQLNLGPLWQHNTLRNLPSIMQSPGISRLERAFPGMPAIVVAAGPSLDDALPVLKGLKDRFVIIAVGAALKSLVRAGIRPHLVVSVDGSHKTLKQFDVPCEDLILVSSPIVYPDILGRFGTVFHGGMETNPISKWVNEVVEPKGMILAGGTVTATALDLAVRMKCNPVITVGLDLCMRMDGKTHADHSMYHNEYFKPQGLIPVPGNFRPTVLTSPHYMTYLAAIEEYLKMRPDHQFINATMDGARINGMELVSPSGIKHFAGTEGKHAAHIQSLVPPSPPSSTANAVEHLRLVAADMETCRQNAVEAIEACNTAMLLLTKPTPGGRQEIMRVQNLLEAFEKDMMGATRVSAFLEMSLRPVYYLMRAKDSPVDDDTKSAIAAHRKSRQFFEQVAGAATWTRIMLQQAADRLQASMPSTLATGPIRCSDALWALEQETSLIWN